MHPHTPIEDQQLASEHYAIYVRTFVDDTPQGVLYRPSALLGYEPFLSATITADLEQPVQSAEVRFHLGPKSTSQGVPSPMSKNLSPYMNSGMWPGGRPLFDPGRYLKIDVKCVSHKPNIVVPGAPLFQAAGPKVESTGAVTPLWPAHQVGDVALLYVETANQTISLTTANGFVQVTGSPQGTGTAGGAAATALAVYWCRATSTTMAAPVVAAAGDHVVARILTFRGVIPTGSPFSSTAAGSVASSASTSVSWPAQVTSVSNCLYVAAVSWATDTATPQASFTGSLTWTERTDTPSTIGNGGGFAVASAFNLNPADYGTLTGTLATSSVQARHILSLRRPDPVTVVTNEADVPWRPIFHGVIDSADPASDAEDVLVLTCRDSMADALDRWIVPPAGQNGFFIDAENVDDSLRDLMRAAGDEDLVPFAVDGDPNMLIPEYFQVPQPLLLAMRQLALQNGWDLRGKWGTPPYGTDLLVLTYYQPDRLLSQGYTYIGPDRVISYRGFTKSRDEVRNRVRVTPSDPPRTPIEVFDATSIAKYGDRFLGVTEDVASRIASSAQASALADAILSDTKEPKIMAELEMRLMPFVEINDLIYLAQNYVHSDTAKYLAVSGYTHTLIDGDGTTVLRTRDAPAAANSYWRSGKPKTTFVSTVAPIGPLPEGAVWTVMDS
jgi:hypothetical protein